MTKALSAEVTLTVVICDVTHESAELRYPRIVPLPVQQVDCLFEVGFADVLRISSSALVIIEAVDVDVDFQLLFDLWQISNAHWVLKLIESFVSELVIIVIWTSRILIVRDFEFCSQNRISEAAVVFVLHIDKQLLLKRNSVRSAYVPPPLSRGLCSAM